VGGTGVGVGGTGVGVGGTGVGVGGTGVGVGGTGVLVGGTGVGVGVALEQPAIKTNIRTSRRRKTIERFMASSLLSGVPFLTIPTFILIGFLIVIL